MASRFRLALVIGLLALAGCSDTFNSGPLRYNESPRLAAELKDKPKLQEAVRKALNSLYGDSPQDIRVPSGSGLPAGGRRLAGWVEEGVGTSKKLRPVVGPRIEFATWTAALDPGTGQVENVHYQGGYTLYRRHCLHCHGVTGDGAGPTADFLFPRPRDYRKGIFKMTSTTTGAKPTRDDLRKTIRQGFAGTSMPAFDALMAPEEIEQVIDYVIFLSLRGETEIGLVDEALIADESQANPIPEDVARGVAESVFNKWKSAESQVLAITAKRTANNRESVDRGREMFLGKTAQKLECWGCHGPKGRGDGPSFVNKEVFEKVVFERLAVQQAIRSVWDKEHWLREGGHEGHGASAGVTASAAAEPPLEPLDQFLKKNEDLWKQSVDDWGQPLRPANLNLGLYKGGRRPIDIYWRISKGINGAKMPAHGSALKPEQIWDLVNFVLALPYEPDLLRNAVAPGPPPPLPKSLATR